MGVIANESGSLDPRSISSEMKHSIRRIETPVGEITPSASNRGYSTLEFLSGWVENIARRDERDRIKEFEEYANKLHNAPRSEHFTRQGTFSFSFDNSHSDIKKIILSQTHNNLPTIPAVRSNEGNVHDGPIYTFKLTANDHNNLSRILKSVNISSIYVGITLEKYNHNNAITKLIKQYACTQKVSFNVPELTEMSKATAEKATSLIEDTRNYFSYFDLHNFIPKPTMQEILKNGSILSVYRIFAFGKDDNNILSKAIPESTPESITKLHALKIFCKKFLLDNFLLSHGICKQLNKDSDLSALPLEILHHIFEYVDEDISNNLIGNVSDSIEELGN